MPPLTNPDVFLPDLLDPTRTKVTFSRELSLEAEGGRAPLERLEVVAEGVGLVLGEGKMTIRLRESGTGEYKSE